MLEDRSIVQCKLKGKFRIKGIKTTNPVAVGDMVVLKTEESDGTGVIREIKKRKNYIIRKATNLSKVSHIIAANIDHAYLIVSLFNPRTSTGFIDRFLVTAEAYHIPSSIIFNKIDEYNHDAMKYLNELKDIYTKATYNCYTVSALEGTNIEELKSILKDKINLFAGHSGVGKSTLINTLEPGLTLKTGEISDYHKKGKHITTFAEMHPLSFGGFIIDTPGIKEFGLLNFKHEEISERFPEMRELLLECKYSNCIHTHEPDCAIKNAVEEGRISEIRYNNYLNILYGREIDEKDWD